MRLIDAKQLEKQVKEAFETLNPVLMGQMLRWIRKQKTIDSVPVIRCRECKQGEVNDPDFPDQYYCHAGCGWNNGGFYCAYGERKEGAE